MFIPTHHKNLFRPISEGGRKPTLNVNELLNEIKKTALENEFKLDTFGTVSDFDLISLKKENGAEKNVYISAGIHGEEPAPPVALLNMMKENGFSKQYNWYIVPLINPVGMSKGLRKNADKKDLNREYKPTTKATEVIYHINVLKSIPSCQVCFFLHEDSGEDGFYMYSIRDNKTHKKILDAAKNFGEISNKKKLDKFPRKSKGLIDGGTAIYDDILKYTETAYLNKLWPESKMYILEAPKKAEIENRIKMIESAIKSALY
jgi:protein MpaA